MLVIEFGMLATPLTKETPDLTVLKSWLAVEMVALGLALVFPDGAEVEFEAPPEAAVFKDDSSALAVVGPVELLVLPDANELSAACLLGTDTGGWEGAEAATTCRGAGGTTTEARSGVCSLLSISGKGRGETIISTFSTLARLTIRNQPWVAGMV